MAMMTAPVTAAVAIHKNALPRLGELFSENQFTLFGLEESDDPTNLYIFHGQVYRQLEVASRDLSLLSTGASAK
jgi:hypothetical protein